MCTHFGCFGQWDEATAGRTLSIRKSAGSRKKNPPERQQQLEARHGYELHNSALHQHPLFAPGVLLLAGLAFVGILMAFEKTFLRGQREMAQPLKTTMTDLARTTNPTPGPIVATLKQSQIQQPVAKRQHKANK